jgi:hypothetical protein
LARGEDIGAANERRDSGQDDLSRPWLDQLVDMDPALAKFGPAIDGQSAATLKQSTR